MTLPTFIVGGAPKAGTTSLYHYLDAHPDIFMCPVKEPDFFHEHFDRGLEWYARLFEGRTDETAIGEASPGTLESAEAVDRIHALVPDMRFVFVLRDPVERAHSQVLYGISRGTESARIPFGQFIRDESDPWRNRVISLGRYADQVERYAARFGRERLHVVLYDDLKADREGVVRSIFEFVGVDPWPPQTNVTDDAHNVTHYPKSLGVYRAVRAAWDPIRARLGTRWLEALYPLRRVVRDRLFTSARGAKPALADADRQYLAELYHDSNQRLAAWLGRDLSGWTSPTQ